ncbi:hypothetical protein [Streptomyces sp. N50]|uniref:hypothetical protein n=1 Tax=Streptomyces sp. N50 TaxID=3081765 RepID=UPI002961EFB6|nr:hypothetical protein [Streptomyces sp. N50]WOX15514.1 hypothetical protein R2B38_44635 [Streptomyces sp. N50]
MGSSVHGGGLLMFHGGLCRFVVFLQVCRGVRDSAGRVRVRVRVRVRAGVFAAPWGAGVLPSGCPASGMSLYGVSGFSAAGGRAGFQGALSSVSRAM